MSVAIVLFCFLLSFLRPKLKKIILTILVKFIYQNYLKNNHNLIKDILLGHKKGNFISPSGPALFNI